MNPFFIWLIKSSVSLALFYIVFKLAFSRDKMHVVNRFALLGILIGSAVLPFFDVPIFHETPIIPKVEIFQEFVTTPVFTTPTVDSNNIHTVQSPTTVSVNPYLIFYLLVILLLFIRLLLSTFRVLQIIHSAEKQPFQNIILAIVKDFIQPFSFIQHIVISEKDFTENKDIVVAHEYAHIKQMHAIDLVVCELFTVLHFFNPFMWLLRHDLKLVHEYQADQAVLNKGIDAKKYQLLVLQKSVGERRFALANHFTQKPILKRLKMMHKKKKNQWSTLKLVLFVPVLILLIQAFARPELITEKVSEIVPNFIQQDSSEVWLNKWTIENLSKINGGLITKEFEFAPPPPGNTNSELPKYDKSRDGHPIASANILTVLVNRNNKILASNTAVNMDELLNGIKNFLHGNPPFKEIKNGPEQGDKNLPFVGDVKVTKGLIILRYDMETKKEFIDNLLLEFGKVHLEARENLATEKFNQNYFSLPADKKNVINQMVPVRVSIMEPKIVKSPSPPPPPNVMELTLKKEGVVIFGKNEYPISEIEQEIIKVKSERAEMYKKWGLNPDLRVNLNVEVGVSDKQISSLKEAFRKAEILHINYSSDFKENDLKDKKSVPPPPPKVLEVLPQNPQYEKMPTVRFYDTWINLNDKSCELTELKNKLENLLPNDGTQREVKLIVYTTTSRSRVEEIYGVLKSIDDLEIIRKDVTPPPPPPKVIEVIEMK